MSIFESIHEENLSIKVQSEILFSPEKGSQTSQKSISWDVLGIKRTYIKVSKESKEQLRELVFKEGFKIKDAAKKLFIKYATAKTIVFHWRKSVRNKRNKKANLADIFNYKG